MDIKVPKIEDFKRVNELAKQVHELHVNWRPDLFLSVENVLSKEKFKELINNSRIFILKEKKEIIAYCVINMQEKDDLSMRYRRQISIEAICVDEKFRGQGAGRKLLEFVKKYGKDNGCTDIHLTCNIENKRAMEIYEKFGFKISNVAYLMEIK